MIKNIFLCPLLILICWHFATAQTIFINEINHLGSDKGVEIAGPATSNLLGWSIVVYNENGFEDEILPLNAVIPDLQNNFGFIWVEVIAGFQGPAGGAVLVNNQNQVVQFISFGTEIKAEDGIVEGTESILAGTQTSEDDALQLIGTGDEYTDFTWNIPGLFTPGAVNNGQDIAVASGAVLPVTWLHFTGVAKSKGIALNWATANEINNDYFNVEYSTDGWTFTEVGKVMSLGDNEGIQQYDFYHQETLSAKNYYRLTQVDFDGKSSISEVVEVEAITDLNNIRIFPNPIGKQLSIVLLEEAESPLTVTIYNTVGQEVLAAKVITDKTLTLDVSSLPKGSYFIKIQGATTAFNQKIIKQ
jgi:hypothetical protein